MKQAWLLYALKGIHARKGIYALTGISVILLAGCAQDEHADLRAFMAQAGAGGQQALEPLPPVQVQEIFSYDAAEQPDPFRPRTLKASKSGGAFQPDLSRPRQPLEQFPLDGLRMVGTLNKGGQTYALIRTPENTLYRIRKGEYMGQNFGLVVAINDTGIELRETVQDGAGDWTETKATLALQE
ncbi:MAG: type IV pilus assembly protein PilP [bacterium]|nr:MAG: type IV pilus assembly protein PilP [bacterium]KAF0150155.1 MAG: type IV pilus assembly protein PilP [bacterium]KAF0169635.1 MAG: type IV pilus assembly protein PilP [bacterium]TXT22973.1 MAG: type IV pilus assembly protein PilP [bacterium]